MQEKDKVTELLLQKFVNEEIMTKSEFQLSLDQMMDRRDATMALRFQTKEEFQLSIDRIMDKHEANMKDNIRTEIQGVRLEIQGVRSDVQEVHSDVQEVRSDMHAMEARIDRQFLKVDGRYNWIISIVFAVGIGIAGLMLKLH